MPSLIANDIIGIQSISVTKIIMNKTHYQHFLKIYNRRKYQKVEDIVALGYPRATINITKVISAKQWCRKNLKDGSFVIKNNVFIFAYEKDFTLFSLRWC